MAVQEENILLKDVSNSTKVNDQPSRLSIFAIFSLFFLSLLISYASIGRPIYLYLLITIMFAFSTIYGAKKFFLLRTLLRYMRKLSEYIVLTQLGRFQSIFNTGNLYRQRQLVSHRRLPFRARRSIIFLFFEVLKMIKHYSLTKLYSDDDIRLVIYSIIM